MYNSSCLSDTMHKKFKKREIERYSFPTWPVLLLKCSCMSPYSRKVLVTQLNYTHLINTMINSLIAQDSARSEKQNGDFDTKFVIYRRLFFVFGVEKGHKRSPEMHIG